MKVTIPYYEIEENAWCEKEGREYYPYSTDMEYEVDVKECEFDRKDLEEIVDRHLARS
ncbi:hypothetical protein [Sulfuracidifex tepidarius]|uniref:hypothetical protein n=1 Tax=Sulfuracidifex tepidarius TaxID=1294262 RepID=UPI000ADB6CFD|nr:hypothetical protein [Sulfuracidifex tepidarius]